MLLGEYTSRIICVQEGQKGSIVMFNHKCTVNDPSIANQTHNGSSSQPLGSTIWTGDTFNCSKSFNQIFLPHSSYEEGWSYACGDFSAMSLSVHGTEYTSRLTYRGNSTLLNGIAINCTLSGGMLVETIAIKVRG